MAKRKDLNNLITRKYEEDQQFDKKIARSELRDFLVKLDKLDIQYDSEENTEILWIKINLKSVSEEQKIKLKKLLSYPDRNFTVKIEGNDVMCCDNSARSSY